MKVCFFLDIIFINVDIQNSGSYFLNKSHDPGKQTFLLEKCQHKVQRKTFGMASFI